MLSTDAILTMLARLPVPSVCRAYYLADATVQTQRKLYCRTRTMAAQLLLLLAVAASVAAAAARAAALSFLPCYGLLPPLAMSL